MIIYSNTSSDINFLNDLDAQSDFDKHSVTKKAGQVEPLKVCSSNIESGNNFQNESLAIELLKTRNIYIHHEQNQNQILLFYDR